ncbi:hypothetical protein ABMA27_014335 [Loxostege sticticalis]|uniref:Uncharacterized protein n=1 Tax=Loxostege sticticalis TaxID=481309 RepID=A0ABR3I8J8_LOXSC
MIRVATRSARRRPLAALTMAALAAALLAAAARVLSPARLDAVAEFPRVRPADLAHLLADVSTHTLIPASWSLEEEAGNYTMWRYAVSYACGARCAGRASVSAHERRARPQHGAATEHQVRVRRRHCRTLPLMPWPQLCDEIETEWLVTGTGDANGGARLEEVALARCDAWAALLAACPAARDLRLQREAQLRRLRDMLAGRAARLHA